MSFETEQQIIAEVTGRLSRCFKAVGDFSTYVKTKAFYQSIWSRGGIEKCPRSWARWCGIVESERSAVWQDCMETAVSMAEDSGLEVCRAEILRLAKNLMNNRGYLNPIDPIETQIEFFREREMWVEIGEFGV